VCVCLYVCARINQLRTRNMEFIDEMAQAWLYVDNQPDLPSWVAARSPPIPHCNTSMSPSHVS